jgi:hypothetical protein
MVAGRSLLTATSSRSIVLVTVAVGVLLLIERAATPESRDIQRWTRISSGVIATFLGVALLIEVVAVTFALEGVHLLDERWALFCAVLAMCLFLVGLSGGGIRDKGLGQVAHMGTLGIFVLAMFAFGIEVHEGGHDAGGTVEKSVGINWREVPAIMIVVLLIELGIGLVERAEASSKKVKEVAGAADAAAQSGEKVLAGMKEATTAVGATTEALRSSSLQLVATVEQLGLSSLVPVVTQCVSRTGMPRAGVIEGLRRFLDSWLSASVANTDFAGVTGAFYEDFIGESRACGTVRVLPEEDSVACVTGDAIFVRACKKRLNTASLRAREDESIQTTVRATTALLPTEFIAPSLWVGKRDSGRSRHSTLSAFVDEVRANCHGTAGRPPVRGYMRVTVFKETEDGADAYRSLSVDPNLSSEKIINVRDLDLCLDGWYVWDPEDEAVTDTERMEKIRQVETRGFEALYCEPDRPSAGIKSGLRQTAPVAARGIYNEYIEACWSAHIFPALHPEAEVEGVYCMFPRPKESGEIGRYIGLLAVRPGVDEADSYPGVECSEEDVDWLSQAGWKSLRTWYVNELHRGDGRGDPALWCRGPVMQDVLKRLSFLWDGFRWTPADLLLLEAAGGGAVLCSGIVSNIQLGRPECTIRLIDGSPLAGELRECYDRAREKIEEEGDNVKMGSWSQPMALRPNRQADVTQYRNLRF